MTIPTMRWMKLYTEMLDDRPVVQLPDHLWRRLVELFLLARRGPGDGSLPGIEDMAFLLRHVTPEELESDLEALSHCENPAIEKRDGAWFVTNFASRNDADTDAERKRRQRDEERHEAVTKRDTDNRSDQDRDQDTDQDQTADTGASAPELAAVEASPVVSDGALTSRRLLEQFQVGEPALTECAIYTTDLVGGWIREAKYRAREGTVKNPQGWACRMIKSGTSPPTRSRYESDDWRRFLDDGNGRH